jgi:hypothetical protein
MTRTTRWGAWLFGGALVLGLASAAVAKDEKAKADSGKGKLQGAPAVATAPAPGEEKVVYTFSDDAKLEEFAKIWQERQATILKMSVLQSYWNEEEKKLEQLNGQFSQQYNVDVKKNYRFDKDQKAIIEINEPVPAPGSVQTP